MFLPVGVRGRNRPSGNTQREGMERTNAGRHGVKTGGPLFPTFSLNLHSLTFSSDCKQAACKKRRCSQRIRTLANVGVLGLFSRVPVRKVAFCGAFFACFAESQRLHLLTSDAQTIPLQLVTVSHKRGRQRKRRHGSPLIHGRPPRRVGPGGLPLGWRRDQSAVQTIPPWSGNAPRAVRGPSPWPPAGAASTGTTGQRTSGPA